MKFIKDEIDVLKDEMEGAERYAEKSVQCKINGKTDRSDTYKRMAEDEIQHMKAMHDIVKEDIEAVKKYVDPPEYMLKAWMEVHEQFVDKYDKLMKILSN
jgi:ferritin